MLIAPKFLDSHVIQSCCVDAQLDANCTQLIVGFAAGICADSELTRLATRARDHLFEALGGFEETVKTAEAVFGADADLLRGLMLLESIRLVRERQSARGVPEAVTRATLESHPMSTLRNYVAQQGRVGAGGWIWSWYDTVGSGNLYSLGRLEFIPEKWQYPFRVFVNTRSGVAVAVLNAGEQFDDAGYKDGAPTWTSELSETEEAIVGSPISPRGHAVRTPIRLLRQEWRQALGPADTVLDMHIPGGEPFTVDLVRDALLKAEPFFNQFYPTQPYVAYVCDSWLFNTQLEAMLSAESKILKMQHEGYLFPNGVGQETFLDFTFGAPTIDLATAPRDTQLRRAVIAHMQNGGTLRCGGFLCLRCDLPGFGSQLYRSNDVTAGVLG